MGGDDFNKTDESDGVLPFAPVAKKQTQMNAEHASWLQETHILESNIEMFESVSKSITKAASQGLKVVALYFTYRHQFFHRIQELVQVLGKMDLTSDMSSDIIPHNLLKKQHTILLTNQPGCSGEEIKRYTVVK